MAQTESMDKLYAQAMEARIRAEYGFLLPDGCTDPSEFMAEQARKGNGSKQRRGKPGKPYRRSEADADTPVTPLVLNDYHLMCFADAMEQEGITFVTMTVRADDVRVEATPADATRYLLYLQAKNRESSPAEKADWTMRGSELRALLTRSV
jgi:hypothetical protein